MPKEAARVADEGAELELDRLKVRIDPLQACSLHRAEQPISSRINFSGSAHNNVVDMRGGDGHSLTRSKKVPPFADESLYPIDQSRCLRSLPG